MSWPKLKQLGRWLAPAALLALTPKCVLCVLAYAGLGAALGLAGPELCGVPSNASEHLTGWLSTIAVAVSIVGIRTTIEKRTPASAVAVRSDPK